MYEILQNLPAGSCVLDLGCAQGSFALEATRATVVRVDRDAPAIAANRSQFVQSDAQKLPFSDRTFDAVISNHSLEHFEGLTGSLREIGRVIKPDGALFVAVPDASTFTDKLYRWLGRGGGHVNAFTSAEKTAALIASATGLRHAATRTLCSSLSFLNRRNAPRPAPRRLLLLGGGHEWSLFFYVWLSRRVDRWLKTRISVYGWAFYFGSVAESIDTGTWVNVCLRCGSGCPSACLQKLPGVPFIRRYKCPQCGATNPFADDR